jgi:hypothetical protein
MAAIGSISDALRVLAGQSGTQIHASTDVALRHEAEVDGAWGMGS